MNALAGALVLIFVLYLIDRHKLWRLTAKVLGVAALLAIMAVGALYEYGKVEERREAQEKARKEAAEEATKEAELAKEQPYFDCLGRNAQFRASDVDKWCKKDPSIVLQPAQFKIGSLAFIQGGAAIEMRCAFDNFNLLQSCGLNDPYVATLHDGDRVEILSNKVRSAKGEEIIKVRFEQWIGWINTNNLNLER